MRYSNAKVADLDPKIKTLVQQNITQDENKFKLHKGIFFYGDTGRGKTYAMYAIRNGLPSMLSKSEIKTWQEYLFSMKLYYSDTKNNRNEFELLKEKDVIFIDDVGAENKTEWSEEMFYMIVNYCYVYEKPLFISTNLSLSDFSKKYGDRISTRLLEMSEVFEMKGINRRLAK